MPSLFMIGKRLVPAEHVAFVEPYEPGATPRIQSTRPFQSRVVMINRDSILHEQSVDAFAAEHGFRMVAADRVATNPAIHFRVETFAPAEGFTPTKPYLTRILWHDLDGNDQSKLLVTEPETVLAIVVRGEPSDEAKGKEPPQRFRQPVRKRKRFAPAREA